MSNLEVDEMSSQDQITMHRFFEKCILRENLISQWTILYCNFDLAINVLHTPNVRNILNFFDFLNIPTSIESNGDTLENKLSTHPTHPNPPKSIQTQPKLSKHNQSYPNPTEPIQT